MNPPSEDLKDILEGISALGLAFPTNLFVGEEPSEPDTCVTIFDTPGYPPQLTFTQGENYFRPSVQIRVRGRNYLTAYSLINDIKEELHGLGPEVINGAVYTVIMCNQEPFLLDFDKNNRPRFVVNFDLQRKEA